MTFVEGNASVATTPNPLGWLSGGVSLLIFLLHFILLEGAYGQTVSKMAVKIKVVQEDGTKIDYAGAAVRNILRVIDAIQFFIPYCSAPSLYGHQIGSNGLAIVLQAPPS